MFSQFRHAVESIAQAPRASVDEEARSPSTTAPEAKGHASTPSWSTNPLAGTALSNIATLGKLVQRSDSPSRPADGGPITRSLSDRELQTPTGSKPRMTLEDRLKMRFALGEASPGDTPATSARGSPSPNPPKRELSPASTPLPASPALSPTIPTKGESPDPLNLNDNAVPSRSSSPEPPSLSNAPEVTQEQELAEPSVPEPVTSDEEPETSDKQPPLPSLEVNDIHDSSTYPPVPYPPSPLDVESLQGDASFVTASDDESDDEEETTNKILPLDITQTRDENKQPAIIATAENSSADIEALRERLKLIEQRFSDVSSSFKRLQAEKLAADKVLQELTPVSGMKDADALREYLQNLALKDELAQDELKRLNGKITRQEERLEELRDIHHLESKSMSDLISKLRKQVEDSDAALKTSKDVMSRVQDSSTSHKADIDRLNSELDKAKVVAKEEEEKRTKAISLLKTVRQKLVKTEKERDDAIRDAGSGKEKEKEEREKELAERARLQAEIDKVNKERENALTGMKAHFDREVAKLKERQAQEITALKGQFELEAATAKSNYTRELSTRDNRIVALERSVQGLTNDKNRFFEQSQLRQAEFESSQSHLESLQSQNTELNYQLRDANERIALLTEELSEARREQEGRARAPSASAEEAARVLALTQTRLENKIADLSKRLQSVEKERNDGEAEWSRKLEEKTKELDRLKQIAQSSDKMRADKDEAIAAARRESDQLRDEIRAQQERIATLIHEAEKVTEVESAAKGEVAGLNARLVTLEKSLEESKSRELQLKASTKTLRDELRKVQSSAALLEKQRNPGIGYYGVARTDSSSDARASRSSLDLPAQNGGQPAQEDVNLEYIRNVILQFLEHENMRPNLVRVLSAVLHFSPQETRRLVAKV